MESDLPIFEFQEDPDWRKENVSCIDLLLDNECRVLYNILTKSECDSLIKQGEIHGFNCFDIATSYRTNERIVTLNGELSRIIWPRVLPYVNPILKIDLKHPTLHTDAFTEGTWIEPSCNDRWRLCKYKPSTFFKSHFDYGHHPCIRTNRSMKTCMLYLNEDFEGGETIFYFKTDKEGEEVFKLKPKTGMCLIFNQKIWHEGATVTQGLKYFVRTDIHYKKKQRGESENPTKLQRALEVYSLAREEDSRDNLHKAVELFREAERMYAGVELEYERVFA